jgi:hypothetical protein
VQEAANGDTGHQYGLGQLIVAPTLAMPPSPAQATKQSASAWPRTIFGLLDVAMR